MACYYCDSCGDNGVFVVRLVWRRDDGILELDDEKFVVTNRVRNEINKLRKLHSQKEVVRAIIGGMWGPPYMPRQFPKGEWNIVGIEYTKNPEFAPIKIKTDAWQNVQVWALDSNGGYDHVIPDKFVEDSGYHLHWAQFSRTTLGCGRVETENEVRRLAELIEPVLKHGEKVILEVV